MTVTRHEWNGGEAPAANDCRYRMHHRNGLCDIVPRLGSTIHPEEWEILNEDGDIAWYEVFR